MTKFVVPTLMIFLGLLIASFASQPYDWWMSGGATAYGLSQVEDRIKHRND